MFFCSVSGFDHFPEQPEAHSFRHPQRKLCPMTKHNDFNLLPAPAIYNCTSNVSNFRTAPLQLRESSSIAPPSG